MTWLEDDIELLRAGTISRREFLRRAAVLGVGAATASGMAAPLAGAAESKPKRGGTLVVGEYQSPRSLNGAVASGMATALPSTQLFASLVRYDDQWNPQPYLAQSWHESEDHKSLAFKLHPDAVFHDGEPVTSEDVAFSIAAIKKHHPFKSMFSAVEKVETPDPHTAVFKLSHPYPSLMIALSPALAPIMPKHIYGKVEDLKSTRRNSQDVVGSGPFKFKKFVPSREIVLERFDKFFLQGRPYLDRLVFEINEDQATLLMSLKRGNPQMLPFMSDPTMLAIARDDSSILMLDKGYEGIGALAWLEINTAKKPFDDKRVRQALAYSLDKDYITKVLLQGFAKPSIGPIISSSPYAEPTHEYALNLEKARKLLDEAGLKPDPDGIRFKMTIDALPGTVAMGKMMAEYARGQFKKIGVKAQLRDSADFPSWATRIGAHNFEMTTDVVWSWGDPVIGVDRMYLSSNIRPIAWTNVMSYRNSRVEKILQQAAVEPDPDRRKALYVEFQRIVTDDVPIIYLVEVPYKTLLTDKVGNPPTSVWGPLSPLDKVYLK